MKPTDKLALFTLIFVAAMLIAAIAARPVYEIVQGGN